MTREEAFSTFLHPIPSRSHYKAARIARRRAVMARVLVIAAALSVIGGAMAGMGWLA